MSTTESTPVLSSGKAAPKRRGPYFVTKIERGLFEERHATAGTVRYRFRFTDADGDALRGRANARDTQGCPRGGSEGQDHGHRRCVLPAHATDRQGSLGLQWQDDWVALIASGDRRPRSLQNISQRLNKWVLPKVGSKQVADVKRVHVIEILNDCRRAGLSPWTIDGVLDAMSGLLQFGVDSEILQRNVARLPKKHKPRVTDREGDLCSKH